MSQFIGPRIRRETERDGERRRETERDSEKKREKERERGRERDGKGGGRGIRWQYGRKCNICYERHPIEALQRKVN
jgi:hypothetical protein